MGVNDIDAQFQRGSHQHCGAFAAVGFRQIQKTGGCRKGRTMRFSQNRQQRADSVIRQVPCEIACDALGSALLETGDDLHDEQPFILGRMVERSPVHRARLLTDRISEQSGGSGGRRGMPLAGGRRQGIQTGVVTAVKRVIPRPRMLRIPSGRQTDGNQTPLTRRQPEGGWSIQNKPRAEQQQRAVPRWIVRHRDIAESGGLQTPHASRREPGPPGIGLENEGARHFNTPEGTSWSGHAAGTRFSRGPEARAASVKAAAEAIPRRRR